MSIFSKILDRLRPKTEADKIQWTTDTTPRGAAAPAAGGASAAPAAAATQVAGAAAAAPLQSLDVEKILNAKAEANGQKLNWRTSIVDLMKLLDLDSSLAARKELATELKYTGDMNDSAAMNIWLHKQVMRKFAENGGTVPADLRD